MKKQKLLTSFALILAILILFLTGYTLLYIITNSQQAEDRLRKQISLEIAGIKVPASISGENGKDGLSIKGEDGKTPSCYFELTQCRGADGLTPLKNQDYFDGSNGLNGMNAYELWLAQGNQGTYADYQESLRGPHGGQGETGASGRTLEQRCTIINDDRRIEQKYTDSEAWEVLYYLSPGQRCPQETPSG